MSRISAMLRRRYAAIGPSAASATLVGQHSQTRESMSESLSDLCALSNVADRSCMSPYSPCVARPSSQMTPVPPSAIGNSVANPCCVIVLSRLGATGAVQVLPSPDQATRRSYASGSGPLSIIQWAAKPPGIARTDGTSAELTIIVSLETTVIGDDQPVAVRSENLSDDFLPSRSTQLRTRRSPATVICGTELFAPAGEVTGSTFSAPGACAAAAAHHIAKPPDMPIHVFFMSLVSVLQADDLNFATSAAKSLGTGASNRSGLPVTG